MHRRAQSADALTMDNAHPRYALFEAQLNVVRHKLANFRRPEGVEVELIADLKLYGIWFVVGHLVSQV